MSNNINETTKLKESNESQNEEKTQTELNNNDENQNLSEQENSRLYNDPQYLLYLNFKKINFKFIIII